MSLQGEQLAIIKGPGYGMRDFSSKQGPGLWFEVKMDDSSGALLCFFGEEANAIFRSGDVYDVTKLSGKPCYVTTDGNSVRFVRLAKI